MYTVSTSGFQYTALSPVFFTILQRIYTRHFSVTDTYYKIVYYFRYPNTSRLISGHEPCHTSTSDHRKLRCKLDGLVVNNRMNAVTYRVALERGWGDDCNTKGAHRMWCCPSPARSLNSRNEEVSSTHARTVIYAACSLLFPFCLAALWIVGVFSYWCCEFRLADRRPPTPRGYLCKFMIFIFENWEDEFWFEWTSRRIFIYKILSKS